MAAGAPLQQAACGKFSLSSTQWLAKGSEAEAWSEGTAPIPRGCGWVSGVFALDMLG